jgi:hypothetical protein
MQPDGVVIRACDYDVPWLTAKSSQLINHIVHGPRQRRQDADLLIACLPIHSRVGLGK